MIGDGPLSAQTREASQGLSNIRLLGGRPDAPSIVAASDVFLSTSTTEGAPGAIIEALLAGVPIVAPNVGGIGETVPGTAGVLTPPGDTAALESALQKVTAQADLRHRLAASTASVSTRFDIRNVSKEYDDLYRSLLPAEATA
jgi:glycosyltransferase involved in cell wall biosynthesis